MANLVYRKSSTPAANAVTAFKGSPLTNDELDNNIFGINAEVQTKAPINNAVFTGTTTIPSIIATGGTINNVTVGATGASTGSFTSLAASGTISANGGDLISSAATFNLVNATATTVNFAGAGSAVTIGALTGTTTIRNANLAVTGSVNVNVGKFTIDSATGNTAILGTLGVTGASTLGAVTAAAGSFTSLSASTTLGVTGAATLNSTLGVVGNFAVNTNKFTVAATTGNTLAAGTFDATGATTLASTLAVTGVSTFTNSVTLAGSATAATEYFKINNGAAVDKFTVDSANGNTVIAGTLGVTGASSFAAVTGTTGGFTDLTLSGNAAVNGGSVTTSATTFNLANTTATTLNIGGAGTAITIGAVTGTTTIRNTLSVTGGMSFGGDLGVGGNFAINTNKFVVTGLTGNTTIAGTLGVTGATTLSSTLGVTGNTTVGGTLGVTGAITGPSVAATGAVSGSTLTSTVATGTAPLTVASTTKVINLQADSVDGMNFATVNVGGVLGTDQRGGVAYALDASNITYVPPGTASQLLQSNGLNSPPTWVSPTGLSAGSSATASNILGGSTGTVLYQSALDNTAKLAIGAANSVLTSSGTLPQWSTSLSLGGTLGVAGVSTLNSLSVTNAATVGTTLTVTGVTTLNSSLGVAGVATLNSAAVTTSATVGTTLTVTGATTLSSTLGVAGVSTLNSLSVTNAATVGTTLTVTGATTLNSTLTHSGLSPSAGSNIDQVYTVTDSALVVNTTWAETSVNAAELANGSYMVQVSTGAGATLEFHTGVMSWFAGDANTTVGDEIVLHRASSGNDASNLFLRVFRSATITTDMVLMISSSTARTAANYTYKFRRML